MTASFPTSVPNYSNPAGSDQVGTVDHAAQHANVNDDVEGIATKIGTGSSTPAAGSLLVGNGSGTSTWLAKGTALQQLRVNAGATALEWAEGLSQPLALTGAAPATPAADTLYKESTVKAYAKVTVSGGTPSIAGSFNVASITDSGVGDLTVTWARAFASANYAVHVNTDNGGWANLSGTAPTTTAARFVGYTSGGAAGDPNYWMISAVGPQS